MNQGPVQQGQSTEPDPQDPLKLIQLANPGRIDSGSKEDGLTLHPTPNRSLDNGPGDVRSDHGLPDPGGEDPATSSLAPFLVMGHRLQDWFQAHSSDSIRKSQMGQEAIDPMGSSFRENPQTAGDVAGNPHSEGHGLSMRRGAGIAASRFEGVT